MSFFLTSLRFKDSSARKREQDVWGTHREEIRQPLSRSSPSTVSLDKAQTTGATRTQIHWARHQGKALFTGESHSPGSSPGPAMRTWKQVTKLLWASSKVERKTMAYFLHKVVRKKKEGRRRDRVQECFESSKRQSRASSANCTGHCWTILGWTTGIII